METIKPKSDLNKANKTSNTREITLSTVDQWRSQLPLSDLSTSAKSLHIILQDIYQTPMSYKTRFDILLHLRPTFSYITQTLQKMYYHQEILNERQRLIADLVSVLYYQQLSLYKLIIADCAKSFFGNRKILLASLQNAFTNCTKIIFEAYLQHRTPMPGIWLEFHKLYDFTIQKKIKNKSLPKSAEWVTRFDTLGDIYQHGLLFSISNPQRLRREEITHLLYALEIWAPLLNLKKLSSKPASLYLVDLDIDSPPKYAALYEENLKNCYALDLEEITTRLQRLLSLEDSQNKEKRLKLFLSAELSLPSAFIRSLYDKWFSIGERANQRTNANGKITTCLGISACHWHISNDLALGETPTDPMSTENIDIDVLPSGLQNETKKTKYPHFSCELLDQSEGGYRLKWPQDIPPQLQSGEIIGLQRELNDERIWSIGTIRWLKIGEDHTITIGVQILSLEALPVRAHLVDSTSQYGILGLLFPEQPERNKPMTLVTPPLPFKSDQEVEICCLSQKKF